MEPANNIIDIGYGVSVFINYEQPYVSIHSEILHQTALSLQHEDSNIVTVTIPREKGEDLKKYLDNPEPQHDHEAFFEKLTALGLDEFVARIRNTYSLESSAASPKKSF